MAQKGQINFFTVMIDLRIDLDTHFWRPVYDRKTLNWRQMRFWGYAALQAFVTALYFTFRYFVPETSTEELERYEFNSLMVLGFLLLIRMVRVDSWLGFFVFAVKATHMIMIGLLCVFSVKFGILFAIGVIIVHFGVDPPFFEMTPLVATLNERILESYIEEVPECYILFYATWEERSIAVTPVFGKIAEKYSTEQRLFARLDIGRSQDAQKKFNISATNGTLRQLPTIIHFKKGEEVKRMDPNSIPKSPMNMPTIVRYFHLQGSGKKNQ